MEIWIGQYGAPRYLSVDQGGEFAAEFNLFCDEWGIETITTASHAHWQLGLAERHGGLLGTIFRKVVHEHKVKGRAQVTVALACCTQAKNATLTRNGLTAEQAVFGRSLRFTEQNTTDDTEDILVGVLGNSGPAWRAQQIRSAAKLHLIRGDATEKIRKAMLRKAPLALGELCPGTRGLFLGSDSQSRAPT